MTTRHPTTGRYIPTPTTGSDEDNAIWDIHMWELAELADDILGHDPAALHRLAELDADCPPIVPPGDFWARTA